MLPTRVIDIRSRRENRAERFLDDFGGSVQKGNNETDMTESLDLSSLRSRFNQASQQAKKTPATVQHLVILAEVVMAALDEIRIKMGDLRRSQRL